MSHARPWLGVCLVLLVACSFAGGSALAGLAFRNGTNALTVTTVRTIVAAAAVLLWLRWRGTPIALPPRQRTIALGLGVIVAFYSWSLYQAVSLMPVSLAVLTFYTYPLMTGVIAWVSGLERPAPRSAVALLLAFVGLTVALNLRSGTIQFGGIGLALAAAAAFTLQLVLSSRLIGRGDPQPIAFHMLASASVIYVLVSALLGDFTLPTNQTGWIAFVTVPLLYSLGATGLYNVVALLGPLKTSLFMNLEPIVSMVFGFLLLDQVLTPAQILGAGLVIAAITLGRTPRLSKAAA